MYRYDRNNDGEIDEKATYIKYRISSSSFDRNFDGKADFVYEYKQDGSPRTSKSDDNFDGVFETHTQYRNGNAILSKSDTIGDGFENYHISFKNGVFDTVTFYSPLTKRPIKIQYFKNSRLDSAKLDTNNDGEFDTTYHYDELEEIIE